MINLHGLSTASPYPSISEYFYFYPSKALWKNRMTSRVWNSARHQIQGWRWSSCRYTAGRARKRGDFDWCDYLRQTDKVPRGYTRNSAEIPRQYQSTPTLWGVSLCINAPPCVESIYTHSRRHGPLFYTEISSMGYGRSPGLDPGKRKVSGITFGNTNSPE